VVLGFEPRGKKRPAGVGGDEGARRFRFTREFRLNETPPEAVGASWLVTQFQVGDRVDVVGTSKGRGFQGVVKRHGFHGGPATHGHKDQLRMPGSIGAGGVQRVFKGTRMAGRMGTDRVTVKHMKVAAVDEANGLLAVKGAIPGAFGGMVMIRAVTPGGGKWAS
jgi:large subunit ribosomal protein L3